MAETHYITTYSGIHFDPVHPRQEDIRMEDIAHSLSLICRGNGQVKQFFLWVSTVFIVHWRRWRGGIPHGLP